MILTGSGPRWQTLVLPQLHHGFRRVGASPLPLGCSSVLASLVISWQCGFLGTRVGEASHPGPPDILGAALSEANPYTAHGSPDTVTCSTDPAHPVLPSPSLITVDADDGSPPPVPGSTSPRRPVPLDSTQPPVPKRRVAVPGRWYCPVASCPDHCPVSSRGWASFSAMKGHCDRHLGGFLEGDLPLDWLQEVGYGVCEVCNRILSLKYRGRCPSCWPSRGGSSRTRRSTNETRRRCQDWLNGVRLELWDPPRKLSARIQTQDRKPHLEASFDLDDHTSTRVHSLIAEGALRRACATLTAEPPVPPTPQVVDELRLLHPGPTDAHREELAKLRPVSPGAAPDVDLDQVRRAWLPLLPLLVQVPAVCAFSPARCTSVFLW